MILETEIGFMCPDKAASRFQLDLSMSGAIFSDPNLPPVVAMNAPSEDQESLRNRL